MTPSIDSPSITSPSAGSSGLGPPDVDPSSVTPHRTEPPESPQRTPEHRPWWRRPWIAPLGLVALAFLVYSLPRYLTFDRERSLVPAPEFFPLHYPILVGHVLFGSVAMLTCCVQVWPWVRRRYPAVHRWSGRAYVFAGVLPAGLCALVDGAVSPFGPVNVASNVLLATTWLGCTVAGYRAARERRFGDHRRWMVRSFALTMSIIVNRLIGPVLGLLLAPRLQSSFGGSEIALGQAASGITAWSSWVLMLLVAQWWLDRPRRRKAAR